MARDYARGVSDAWNANQMIGKTGIFHDRRDEAPAPTSAPKPKSRSRGGRGGPSIKTR